MSRSTDAGGTDGDHREIRLIENHDGWGTARDLETGAVSQGETPNQALRNLEEAVEVIEGGGHEPTDAELRVLGIGPEVARSQDDELPDVLRHR